MQLYFLINFNFNKILRPMYTSYDLVVNELEFPFPLFLNLVEKGHTLEEFRGECCYNI